jgi:hypothetical protein
MTNRRTLLALTATALIGFVMESRSPAAAAVDAGSASRLCEEHR